MAEDGHLNFDTRLNSRNFRRGINNIENSLSGVKKTLLGIASAAGLAFGVKEMIESAAEVKAATSQMAQTFGEFQDEAEYAIERVAKESGILETRLNSTATGIYAFAKTAGMDSVQALDMMQDALQVAADSAAYYDRSLEDTSETLKSFLKGNYANDAALGISATDYTRNAAAMKLYGKKFQELSEAQKQLTLLQMVKDANRLSGAEGQAAREADGWENVLGNLKETWKQLMAVLGQPMLQVATAVVKRLTAALGVLLEKAKAVTATLSELFGWEVGDSAAVSQNISDSVDAQEALTDAVNETAKAQQKSLAGFDKINTIASNTADSASASSGTSAAVSVAPKVDDEKTEKAADALSSKLQKYIKPIELAWKDNSPELISNAKKAAKAIQELFKSIGASISEVWLNGSGERFVGNLIKLFSDVIGIIGDIAEALKNAWNDGGRGTALIQSYADRFNSMLELIHVVGDSFREAWNDGTGEEILANILEIITNINNVWANLREQFIAAWTENDRGAQIFSAILGIVNSVLSTINELTSATAEWAKNIDFSPILESIQELLEAIKPLVDTLGSALVWVYENALLPIASWTIEKAAPATVKLLSSALKVLTSVIQKLEKPAKWLFENFLKPLAKWSGNVVISLLGRLTTILQNLANVISGELSLKDFIGDLSDLEIIIGSVAAAIGLLLGANAIRGLITSLATLTTTLIANTAAWVAANLPIIAVGAAIAAVIAVGLLLVKHWEEVKEFMIGVWDSISEAFSVAAEFFSELFTNAYNGVKKAWNGVVKFFKGIYSDIKKVFSAAGEWFGEHFHEAFDAITSIFSGIGAWFGERWDDITSVFSGVGNWFGNAFSEAWGAIKLVFSNPGEFFKEVWKSIKSSFRSVTTWFRETFSKAWQAVKDVFSTGGMIFQGIAESIADVFVDVVNSLIDGINWVISQPFNAINSVLDGIRNFTILKKQPFSWLPEIPVPEIPHLAQGTVVPANYGNFLAMLGDNKRETEVVSPLSTMKKALSEALAESGGTTPKEIIVYTYLYPNSAAFHREVVKIVNTDKARKG